MNFGSLFSGIGGLDLGLERAGMHVRWQCELDPFCRRVLAKHWPGVPCYEDIRTVDASAERVDLICGGFPCQPVSLAGKGLAQEDPRWLWPEFARVVGLLRPRFVVVENVPGLRKRGLSDVVGDLAALRYDAEWQLVSAASVGAPHLRERYFIMAHSAGIRRESWLGCHPRRHQAVRPEAIYESDRRGSARGEDHWATEPDVGRVAHGVPARMDRLRALGNAVVPQVAEHVGRLILERAA